MTVFTRWLGRPHPTREPEPRATTMTVHSMRNRPRLCWGARTCEFGVSNCIGRRTVRGSTTLRTAGQGTLTLSFETAE
jgi:hypothetical protein